MIPQQRSPAAHAASSPAATANTPQEARLRLTRLERTITRLEREMTLASARASGCRSELSDCRKQRQVLMSILNRHTDSSP